MTTESLIKQLDGIVTKKPKSDWAKYQRSTVEHAIEAIKAQQWISCSEKLPESNSERIILLYDNGLISSGKYLGDRTFDIDFRDNDKKTKVVAWIPMPEPYESGVKQ